MQFSAEVRWFFEGTIPSSAQQWFGTDGKLATERRIDDYLVIPQCDCAGIKVRSTTEHTRLEVKTRLGEEVTIAFSGGIGGVAQRWGKWSSAHVAGARSAAPGERWVSVHKLRSLRKVARDGNAFAEVDCATRPAQGCIVELSEILVSDHAYWSVGLEAFGNLNDVSELLRTIGTWFFLRRPLERVALTRQHSMPYPSWVALLP